MVEAEEAVHPRWKVCFCFSLESRVSLCHAGMHALRSSFRSRRNGLTFPRILCVLDLEGYFWARCTNFVEFISKSAGGAPAKILKKFAARPDFNKIFQICGVELGGGLG